MKPLLFALALLQLTSCATENPCHFEENGHLSPSDDPNDYEVDTSVNYEIQVSEPRFVVPSIGMPAEAGELVSNANVDIIFYHGRLFMAYRNAPIHFANGDVVLYIMSSVDGGYTWEYEDEVDFDADIREPRFLIMNDELQLLFFEGGDYPLRFEPQRVHRMFRSGPCSWTKPEIFIDDIEVPWDVKVRGGVAYMTSYKGNHYDLDAKIEIEVYFRQSTDGRNWSLVDEQPYVYKGGVSEVAFEFNAAGGLWAVTRNEDGDETGFGSHVCSAAAGAIGTWTCSAESDPNRYDSPEMFRHGDEIYLVARRDIGGPFGPDGAIFEYSLRPKRTALYRIDRETKKVVHLFDLPGAGDTAFPSIIRTSAHTFLLANYTSPLGDPDISWLDGQTHDMGTQIYFLTITFQPVE